MIGIRTHGFIHLDLQNKVNAALQIQPQMDTLPQPAFNTVLPDGLDALSPVIAEKNEGHEGHDHDNYDNQLCSKILLHDQIISLIIQVLPRETLRQATTCRLRAADC